MLAFSELSTQEAAAPRSQATYAHGVIRADILAGCHPPDKKLKIQDLAKELSVSPGAVREALSRLVPEQLVLSRDQRGFTVAPLSIADLEDLTSLRCEIEAVALRRSLERGDLDWEAGLIAAAHRLNATPTRSEGKRTIPTGWVIAHARFHAALVAAAGSPRLLALHAQLYEQSERYRGLSAHLEGDRNVATEHQEIVDLALARDTAALVRATTDHLRKTTALIVEAAKRNQR
jgi:DNA-binding GntR family transcriptional regulator